jgi:hypothetical protein
MAMTAGNRWAKDIRTLGRNSNGGKEVVSNKEALSIMAAL